MAKFSENPQTLKDFMIGMAGSMYAAAVWAYSHAAYILGLLVTVYALYNQHLQAQINRKKLNENDNTPKKD
jgi:hypothetical protein